MVTGQYGSRLSSISRECAMNFANGPPVLSSLPSLPRRLLYTTSSRMTSRAPSHPPNRRLWHPTNGVVFQSQQQPLYPVLDVARFSTEASSASEAEMDTGDPVPMLESKGSRRLDLKPIRKDTRVLASKDPRSQPTRTKPNSCPIPDQEATSSKPGPAGGETSPIEDLEAAMQGLCVEDGEEAITDNNLARHKQRSSQEASAEAAPTQGVKTYEAPFTPLEYKMCHQDFEAAKIAEKESSGSYWSYSLYRGPDKDNDIQGKVRVHYCMDSQAAERALQYFVDEKMLGLDLEWSPRASKAADVRKNVSLVQIASESRIILMHLALYPPNDTFVTPTLQKLLEDPNVTKSGVWIKGDCTRIRNFLGIEVRGMFELSHLYKQVKYSASRQPEMINKKFVGLGEQIHTIMGLPMKKDMNVRASDWSQALNMEQIGYSASDAYAAVQLFAMLNHQRENLDPCPALPFHVELDRPIPVPPGLEPPPEETALTEEDVADEKELEAATEGEAGVESSSGAGAKSSDTKLAAARSEVVRVLDAKAKGTKKAKPAADSAPAAPKDPRLEAAEVWLAEYRAERKTKAGPAALKAYHIWQSDKELDCVSIAKILRNPPLQKMSVATYILSSVMMEKLPYDKTRMKDDVFAVMPPEFARKRFYPIWQAVAWGM